MLKACTATGSMPQHASHSAIQRLYQQEAPQLDSLPITTYVDILILLARKGQAADFPLCSEGPELENSSTEASSGSSNSSLSISEEESAVLTRLDHGLESSEIRKCGTKAGISVLKGTKGLNSTRKRRNRIRETAGKEAEARARRVQQPLIQDSVEAEATTWDPLVSMWRTVFPSTTTARVLKGCKA